jgi:probable rRNA maturation factor
MTRELLLRNRQRECRVDLRRLRRITHCLLTELVPADGFELAIHLIGPTEMTRLHETFLRQASPTDVLTFDYSEPAGQADRRPSRRRVPVPAGRKVARGAIPLRGEILICPNQAVRQARQFHTTWQSEIVRYVVHGVLHLLGYDDLEPAARTRMKRAESRLVGELAQRFAIRKLAQASSVRGQPAMVGRPSEVRSRLFLEPAKAGT